jgi:HlyD family secretion protein
MSTTDREPSPVSGEALVIPPLSRNARWRRLILVLLLAGGGVAAWYFSHGGEMVPERYRTAEVERRDIVRVVDATATLDVRRRVAIPAPMNGQLTEIKVGVRDHVTAGQVLARLDGRAATLVTASADAEVGAAGGRVSEARAALEAATREAQRADRLLARGLVSRQEADAAHAKEDQAHAALSAAQGALAVAERGRAQARFGAKLTDITAPEEGVVMMAPEAVGAAVAPDGKPLFILGSSLEELRVDARVGEADIGAVKVGQEAEFQVLAYPDRSFSAHVTHIGLEPVREGALVYYPVSLAAANPDGALLPGMSATVHMRVAEAKGVLAVPEAALRFTPEDAPSAAPRTRVFLREGPRKLAAVAVTAGISDGAFTEVIPKEGARLEAEQPVAVGLNRGGGGGGGSGKPGIALGGK